MAPPDRHRPTIDNMHSRTAALAKDASADGDEFLAYLYTMALQHIEEKVTEARRRRA